MRSQLVAASAVAAVGARAAQTCYDGAYILCIRGTTEEPGPGIIGTVADEIAGVVPNSKVEGVPYPATFDYFNSEVQGVGNLTKMITDYSKACKNNKIVLMGYSQGAQIIGDTLIGSDDYGFSEQPIVQHKGIDTSLLKNIAAIIMMGDPTHAVGQSFNVGNATMPGLFGRENSKEFTKLGLADRMQSYCDADDPYCSDGSNHMVHLGYAFEYGSNAAAFVVEQLKKAGVKENGTITATYSPLSPTATTVPADVASGISYYDQHGDPYTTGDGFAPASATASATGTGAAGATGTGAGAAGATSTGDAGSGSGSDSGSDSGEGAAAGGSPTTSAATTTVSTGLAAPMMTINAALVGLGSLALAALAL